MRGWKLIVIGILLGVPGSLAATQIHTFRADPAACAIPLRECSLSQHGALQVECQGNTCVFVLTINATYQANLAQTSKVVRAYGRDWTGAVIPVCDVRSSALSVTCASIAQRQTYFPTTGCKTFEAIAEAIEQPLNVGTGSAVADAGIRHTSISTMCVMRNGNGQVIVNDA